ncbi:MAG: hypothetical protein II333_02115 [Clostridia bacterium]|nr:hypothetical protein [Clostridia bacterium]
MKKLTVLLLALGLLTGCGAEKSVPQTAEEIDTFGEVLMFVSGQTEADVTSVQVLKESDSIAAEPIALSDEETKAILALLESAPAAVEAYEPVPVYGGSWYSVIFSLESGGTVTLYPEEDMLTFTRAERNEEEQWYYPAYRLLYEETDVPERIYAFAAEKWISNND